MLFRFICPGVICSETHSSLHFRKFFLDSPWHFLELVGLNTTVGSELHSDWPEWVWRHIPWFYILRKQRTVVYIQAIEGSSGMWAVHMFFSQTSVELVVFNAATLFTWKLQMETQVFIRLERLCDLSRETSIIVFLSETCLWSLPSSLPVYFNVLSLASVSSPKMSIIISTS